jgi:hypothetical protein
MEAKEKNLHIMQVSCTSISFCRYVQCQHGIYNYRLHYPLQIDNNVEPSNKHSDILHQYFSFYFTQYYVSLMNTSCNSILLSEFHSRHSIKCSVETAINDKRNNDE